jgi:hypothetical protein
VRFLGEFDVVVAGGGTAGSAAAITAGRLGLSCLVVEPLTYLGGSSTGGLVTPMMGNHVDGEPLNPGFTAELLKDAGACDQARGYAINPEFLKGLLERKALEAGVSLAYESRVSGAQVLSPQGMTLTIATRSGHCQAAAATVIDATGDARVAQLAGAPVLQGREADGQHQPMSLRFVMGGVHIDRFGTSLRAQGGDAAARDHGGLLHSGDCMFLQARAQKDGWPADWLKTFGLQFFQTPGRPGELWFNSPRVAGFDPLDPISMSQAYATGRQLVDAIVALLCKHVDGAQDAHLVMAAPLMGIREGQRLDGLYKLTADDFHNRRKFSDGICANRYPIDIHSSDSTGVTLIRMPPGEWHEIPFRCLVPRNTRSLLAAGRCISSDFVAQASYRIIPNCHTLGEAAAVAASVAHGSGQDVSSIDGQDVRQRMTEMAMLPVAGRG